MRRLVWLFGWTGVAVWSLFAALTYWLFDGVGGLIVRHADRLSTDPDTVVWIANTFGVLRGVSTSAVLVVWGVVSLAILSVPWLFDRVTATQGPPSSPFVPSDDGRFAQRQDGVIDLNPGEYSVRPVDSRSGPGRGSVPAAGPRR